MVIDPSSGVILLRLRHATRMPPGSGRSDRRNRRVFSYCKGFIFNFQISLITKRRNKKEKNKMLMTTLLILHSIFNHDVMWRAANFLQCCDLMGDSCKGRVYELERDR
ncbi:uncharacterized protein LOC121969819 [Zingiber officinale]|uniref:uncharacterized protein LOC121969819 n=1 Tax=Zingiber officinale TaxID=94328 RepID=UPI001C4CB87A|nr:uncharacterized protein LOC121969819 [Zingiber officinale]